MCDDREKLKEKMGKSIENNFDGIGGGDCSSYHEERAIESNIVDLIRRMDRTDEELKAVKEGMRSRFMHLRNHIQELDKNCKLLKDIVVDELLNKLVEEVIEEIKKANRDKAKMDAVRDDSTEDILQSKGLRKQIHLGSIPIEKLKDSSKRMEDVSSGMFNARRDYRDNKYYHDGGHVLLGNQFSEIRERLEQTEEEVKDIHDFMGSLKDVLSALSNKADVNLDSKLNEALMGVDAVSCSLGTIENAYYEAYVTLVGDYLILCMGEKGAEQLLLEGLYKGWANTNVVRDIIDTISSRSRKKEGNGVSSLGFAFMNTEIEDKILLTSLLRNLDKPPIEWSEPIHLFLMLALVTRAREAKLRRP